jgi:iron complex transport system ATP-binding protein
VSHVLEARGLAAGRGAELAVRGVDLDVAPGERVALVGANGSGKTTLLRVFAGLDAPRAGTIAWQGAPLPSGAARVRRVGVLTQEELASGFRLRELVTLGLGEDGPPGARARRSVDECLARHQLTPLAERACTSLSGGEARRGALARTLVAAPALLLLDEPTNHLDPARHAELCAWLTDDARDAAVVLATHDLTVASRCDRVLLLEGGAPLALGAPEDVLTPPLVARALGVHVRRVVDPEGGPPLLRVLAPVRREVAA